MPSRRVTWRASKQTRARTLRNIVTTTNHGDAVRIREILREPRIHGLIRLVNQIGTRGSSSSLMTNSLGVFKL